MRLIDADALRDELWRMSPQTEQLNGYEIRAFVDAAPTISCEECEHAWDGVYDKSIVHCRLDRTARGRDWFCGDFQRRQP